MRSRESRRAEAIERMADYLLLEGLGAATLRPLAAAAGTSDRMLLYYFKDRDEILSATLHHFAERLLARLDEAIPPGKFRSFRTLLDEVGVVLTSVHIRPSMHLWLDLAAGASRGLQPHLKIASEVADRFMTWITSRLVSGEAGRPRPSAALFLTLVEGMHVLEAFGRPDIGNAAATELIALLPTERKRKSSGRARQRQPSRRR